MLVTFHTKPATSITMFGDVALELLKMMGHSGTVPGALVAGDVPNALAKLRVKTNLVSDTVQPNLSERPGDNAVDAPRKVLFQQYAYPLIELLTAAADGECDVTWEEGNPAI